MRKLILAAATALCLVPAAISTAQQQPDLQGILSNIPLNVALQTQRTRATYLGPDLWTDLAPATYSIRAPGTNLCLTRVSGGGGVVMDHIRLSACNVTTSLEALSNANQLIQAVPAAVDVPPSPGISNVRFRFTHQENQCATTARNVVFGPARVDWLPCDLMPYAGGDIAHRGGPDQLFFLRRVGSFNDVPRFQIRTPDRKCWTVRDGNISESAEVVMEECDNRVGQNFEFRYNMSLLGAADIAAAGKFGWVSASSAGRQITSADRFRDLPALSFGDAGYSTVSTANDLGADCAAMCRADDNCRAFSWTAPRAAAGPQCKLMITYWQYQPVEAPGTNSGIMRP